MNSYFKIRSNRFLKSLGGDLERPSTRKHSARRGFSFFNPNHGPGKTEKLQKSLESIRVKKQEVELIQDKLTQMKLKRLRVKIDVAKVEIKFFKSALVIQKWFRGHLVRRIYKEKLLEHFKRNLESGIEKLNTQLVYICRTREDLERSAVVIQKNFKMKMQRKRFLIEKNRKIFFLSFAKNLAAKRIQKAFKRFLNNKNKEKEEIFKEKIKKIAEKLKEIRVGIWWEKHKFSINVIKKHYELLEKRKSLELKLDTMPVIIVSTEGLSTERKESKRSRKSCKNNMKVKIKNVNSLNFDFIPRENTNFLKENEVKISENLTENQEKNESILAVPLEKIKNSLKDFNLDEMERNSIYNEISESSQYHEEAENKVSLTMNDLKSNKRSTSLLLKQSNNRSLTKRSQKKQIKKSDDLKSTKNKSRNKIIV